MQIEEQLDALERVAAFEDWFVRTWLDEAYLVRLTSQANRYAVVHVVTDAAGWHVGGGYVDLAVVSYADARRAVDTHAADLVPLARPETEGEVVMCIFTDDPERWTEHTWSEAHTGTPLEALVARAVETLLPSAPPEVCARCLERTGGVAVPPEGQHFAVGLTRNVRVGGRLWMATDTRDANALYPVERSDFAPHHLVACEDEQRQPVCLLPAASMNVWTVDD